MLIFLNTLFNSFIVLLATWALEGATFWARFEVDQTEPDDSLPEHVEALSSQPDLRFRVQKPFRLKAGVGVQFLRLEISFASWVAYKCESSRSVTFLTWAMKKTEHKRSLSSVSDEPWQNWVHSRFLYVRQTQVWFLRQNLCTIPAFV